MLILLFVCLCWCGQGKMSAEVAQLQTNVDFSEIKKESCIKGGEIELWKVHHKGQIFACKFFSHECDSYECDSIALQRELQVLAKIINDDNVVSLRGIVFQKVVIDGNDVSSAAIPKEADAVALQSSKPIVQLKMHDENKATATSKPIGLLLDWMPTSLGEELLKQHGKENSIAFSLCLQILLSTARGCLAFHKAGVVHRDIHPDNIKLGTSLCGVQNVDVKLALSHQTTTTLVKSNNFLAPEQLALTVHPAYTKQTQAIDVYGFAGVICVCLTNCQPWATFPAAVIIANVTKGISPLVYQTDQLKRLVKWDDAFASYDAHEMINTDTKSKSVETTALTAKYDLVHFMDQCFSLDPNTRPSMTQVVQLCQELIARTTQSADEPITQLSSRRLRFGQMLDRLQKQRETHEGDEQQAIVAYKRQSAISQRQSATCKPSGAISEPKLQNKNKTQNCICF